MSQSVFLSSVTEIAIITDAKHSKNAESESSLAAKKTRLISTI